MDRLEGTAANAGADTRLVIYALSRDSWYVQPLTIHPYTKIGADGTWSGLTHLGSRYAALLVRAGYRPPNTFRTLPASGGSVLAVGSVSADPSSVKPLRSIHFSGYDWAVSQLASDRHGAPHEYLLSNVDVDSSGSLHLRVTKHEDGWTCSEVSLPRSLGYGRYILSIENAQNLEPATVFDMFTWDQDGTDQDRREVDSELTRWGDPNAKDGEYTVQPFFRPTNTYRYEAGPRPRTLTMLWQRGTVKFSTTNSNDLDASIAEHTFVADVPSPQTESVHLNLCTFDYGKLKESADAEIVLKSFRYLP